MNKFTSISRREFLKFCAYLAGVLGLSQTYIPQIAFALEKASKKPPVIWLEGQDCAGCTISFIGTLSPSTAEIILDTISLRYHETVMAASGDLAEKALEDTIAEGDYILVVEGSIPTADKRFCTIGDRPFSEIVEKAAKDASAIIAVGACAAFGGIPAAGPTGAKGVSEFLARNDVINISTCPAHTEHVVGTIVYYLLFGKAPELDENGRPKMFFRTLIHDNCERRGHFEKGEFLTDWNDPQQRDWCLYLKGCKGPFTYSDCPIRKWNEGINWCVECGAGCFGCAEPTFYAGMTPFFERTQEIRGVNVDTIGKVLGAATLVGIGAHFVGQAAKGRLGKGGGVEGGEE
jgi:hydrogenase small subunit